MRLKAGSISAATCALFAEGCPSSSHRRDSELDAVSGLRLVPTIFLTKGCQPAAFAPASRPCFGARCPAAADNARRDHTARPLSIDGEKMQTTWNGAPVTLSLTEFWIVHALARNPGHVKNRRN